MKGINLMLLPLAVLAIAGCSHREPESPIVPGEEQTDGYVYMDLSMQLPATTGTRSSTDWDDEDGPQSGKDSGDSNSDAKPDIELGHDYENTVKTVLLVLAGTDGSFISYAEVQSGIAKTGNAEYSIKAKFKRDDIKAAYDNRILSESQRVINIYAYVNYTKNLHTEFSKVTTGDTDWLDMKGTIDERPSKAGSTPVISNTIWAKHSFLMTNARIFTATFPESDAAWDAYADSKNPYVVAKEDYGSIIVERSAARIDFKDASNTKVPNTYKIIGGLTSTGGDDDLNLINVQLTRMSLVNMSKDFYYLRRVADDYDDYDHGKVRIGKYETMTNFVADTDWKDKYNREITPGNAKEYFNFCLYDEKKHTDFDHYNYNRGNWYTDNINDILERENDTYEGNEYHIWRYVTENTLPDIESQQTVQSTGIIFKGLILPGEHIDFHIGGTINDATTHDETETTPRYISKKVKEALIASEHHLPMLKKDNNKEETISWWDGITDLDNSSKYKMFYDYPVLYEFDGLLYAGIDEVVKRASVEGQGSLMYAVVENALKHWTLKGKAFEYDNEYEEDKKVNLTIQIYNEIRNGVKHENDDQDTDYTTGDYSIVLYETATEDENSPESKLATAFKHLMTTYAKADASTSNFTIYEASYEDTVQEQGEGWGYYCYYFYWNRHNDNGLNGKMGPMEFAVVRNNVYKLSVKTISRLGHPRNPDNDPDPFNPDDPDEDSRVYLTVDLKVLPWVVRTNEIEF